MIFDGIAFIVVKFTDDTEAGAGEKTGVNVI
jgi:hypothetical protein